MTSTVAILATEHPRARAKRLGYAPRVFLVAMVIYLAFFGGHYVMGDNADRIAWAKSMIDHHFGRGSTDISAYPPNDGMCKYGIGHSLMHVPFLLLARAIQHVTHISCEGPINMLPYVLNGALGVLLVYLVLRRRLGLTPRAAAWRALIVGVSTSWFVYTKVEYSEAIVATCALAIWYIGLRRPMLAGLIAGAAITLRPDALLWSIVTFLGVPARMEDQVDSSDALGARMPPPLWMSRAWFNQRLAAMPWLLLGMAPGVALVALSNYWRTGNPLLAGYEPGFTYSWLAGVYGLLFSAGKGVFFFSPLLILLIPAAMRARAATGARADGLPRRVLEDPSAARILWERRATAIWALVLLGAQVLFYGKWWAWHGDDAWGPRFLTPSMMAGMLVVVSTPLTTRAWRWSFAALAAVGIMVQLPPVLMGPHESLMLTHLRQPMKTIAAGTGRQPITLEDEHFDPRYSQLTATFELLELKLSGSVPRASVPHAIMPHLSGSRWVESFDPPLKASDVPVDIFWLNPRHKG